MKPSKLYEALHALIGERVPLHIWGVLHEETGGCEKQHDIGTSSRSEFDRIWPVGEYLVVIAFRSDFFRQGASEISSGIQSTNDRAEVVLWSPGEFITSTLIDIDPINAGKHLPTQALVCGLIVGNALTHYLERVVSQPSEIVLTKWRGGADYIFTKAQAGRALRGQHVGADHIFDVDTSVKILVGLQILIREGSSHFSVVILLGEESRCSEHEACEPLIAMEQLAEILGGGFGRAVDIFRNWHNIFGNPCRRSSGGRHERVAEHTCCACIDKGFNAGGNSSFQKIECAGYVGIHKLPPAVGSNMRLM